MRKSLLSTAILLMICGAAFAQPLNGSYTIAGSSPDFSTLSAAISALNSRGVNGPVEFLIRDGNYSGNSWRGSINNISGASATNRITFRSQSGNKSNVVIKNNSSANYIFKFNGARYITVKDLTLVKNTSSYCRVFDFGSTTASFDSVINCVLEANKTQSSSTSRVLVYANSHTGTDNVFYKNEFVNGGSFIYWRGSNTSTRSKKLSLIENTFNASSSGYYGIYTYYTSNLKIEGNNLARTGSGNYYPCYNYYSYDNYDLVDNSFDVTTTSYIYYYQYRINYVSNSSANVTISGNTADFVTNSGRIYAYTAYTYNCTKTNNVLNARTTTGYKYVYNIYYAYNSVAHDNEYNLESTSSGRTYYYDLYNGSKSKSYDNTMNSTNKNGLSYLYLNMYGSNNEMYENTINATMTSAYVYTYAGYDCGSGGEFHHNNVNLKSTTGSLYGVRHGYSVGNVHHNKFTFASNSGLVYGMYPYYMNNGTVYSNTYFINTNGTVYNMYPYRCNGGVVANNTLHNNGNGTGGYLLYDDSRTKGTFLMKNNILSRKTGGSNMVYTYNGSYTRYDYNLYYTPGNMKFRSNQSPSKTVTTLHEWREATGHDMNSLFYQPPYVDAANGDLTIDAANPAAWAVNGRAEHDTTVKTDFAGTPRPILAPNGVPDLGAFEVVPTSTPPNAKAYPAAPVANSTQVFVFGQDTVATIDWGATVPTSIDMRQYSGVQAGPMPVGVGRMYFYTAVTPSSWVHPHTANIHYKEPWIGDIPSENEAVIARSSNGGAWEGYNYTNAATNTSLNRLAPVGQLDSVGAYTGVQNGRIGIRCVEDPKGITITNVTAFEADIDWNPVFNPIGYQVVFKKILEAPSVAEWNNAAFPTSNSIAANGLDEDTQYYMFIRSVCGVGDTSGYSIDSFATIITCHKPSLGISDISESRAVVYWNKIKTAVKYEYALTTSETPPAYGTDLNKTSVLATFLDPGKLYYAHVRAHCNTVYEQSDWSTEPFTTWSAGIGDIAGNNNGLVVYPNPVANEMTVMIGGEVNGTANITVMDMTGKVLKAQTTTTEKLTINVSELPSGMYILRYTNDADSKQVKFRKQ